VLALSTGHEVGLAVTAGAFIAFALASSFLFPRYRPNYPGGGLLAFVVVSVVFFFGMLTAVEVFGAEDSEAGGEQVAETGAAEPTTSEGTTTQEQETTTAEQTTSTAKTTTAAEAPEDVKVTESEFKIAMPTTLSGGRVVFEVKNDGTIPHDLAIKGGPKTKLIQAGGEAQFEANLKPGKYHLYCTVPGHEQAGMKIDITVS
jgi:uncharacterized cupredoxin-like copper-binding protein